MTKTKTVVGHFNDLHMTECTILGHEIKENIITIIAKNIFVTKDHPLNKNSHGPYSGKLVFNDVSSSSRIIIEYIGDPHKPDGHKEPYTICDNIIPHQSNDKQQNHFVEGVLNNPSSWISWDIKASSFMLIVDQ